MDGAFNPTGLTCLLIASDDPPPGIAVYMSSRLTKQNQYRFYNDGLETAFVAFGLDAATAKANAVIPTEGHPTQTFPIIPGSVEVLTGPSKAFISAITPTGHTKLYITPGRGV